MEAIKQDFVFVSIDIAVILRSLDLIKIRIYKYLLYTVTIQNFGIHILLKTVQKYTKIKNKHKNFMGKVIK